MNGNFHLITKALIVSGLLATSAQAALVYEGFADSDPTLSGNTSGDGLTGTWSSTSNFSVSPGSLSWGNLETSGNRVTYSTSNGGASVGLDSSLSTAGLLDDNDSLWFSMIVTTPTNAGTNAANADTGFAIGTDPIPQTAMQGTIGADKYAIGWTIKSGKLQASIWNAGANVRGTNGPSVSLGTTYLIVGEIVWGATNADLDTIRLYLPDSNLNLGSAVASASAVIANQSGFDTISTGLKTNGGYAFDEIRFDESYIAVTPQIPAPAALPAGLALLGFALMRRRIA